MTLLMELNSSRANTHISVASSAGDTMEDIMNTRCQSLMMNVWREQNMGSHKLCPIGHITIDSPDTGLGPSLIWASEGENILNVT